MSEMTVDVAKKFVLDNSKMNESGTVRTMEKTATRKFFKEAGIPESVQKTYNEVHGMLVEATALISQDDLKVRLADPSTKDMPKADVKSIVNVKGDNSATKVTTYAETSYQKTERQGDALVRTGEIVKTPRTSISVKQRTSAFACMQSEGMSAYKAELDKIRK